MAKKKPLEVQKQESQATDVERTRSGRTFVPYTDIIENENGLTLLMDIPGVVEEDVDINLEDTILTITARVAEEKYEGYRPLYSEYNIGDFQRSFRLIEDFDADKVEASLKNGVLTLVLPKSEKLKPRKIKIKS
ncbi:Hsp20/alpha crystallin family protein [candidate division CSSED10-310 bacterium]|uniref:Hsp20/alpha crystallin family protein n=1 Tax=candidate division CSSED10-310 bacterium TaxID=2855610 RepID=A0ABV6YU21_UNCC1